MTEIKFFQDLGPGLASGVGIHVGERETTGFIQGSRGDVKKKKIDPPLDIKRGLTSWKERWE